MRKKKTINKKFKDHVVVYKALHCKHCCELGQYAPHTSAYSEESTSNAGYPGSCRGIRSDYRTVMCLSCGKTATYDFATD